MCFCKYGFKSCPLKRGRGAQYSYVYWLDFFYSVLLDTELYYPFFCASLSCFGALRSSCHPVQLRMKTGHKHRLLLDSIFAGRNGFKTLFCEWGISPTESQAVLKTGINSCLYCVSSGTIRTCILELPCMGCEVTFTGENMCSSLGC